MRVYDSQAKCTLYDEVYDWSLKFKAATVRAAETSADCVEIVMIGTDKGAEVAAMAQLDI